MADITSAASGSQRVAIIRSTNENQQKENYRYH